MTECIIQQKPTKHMYKYINTNNAQYNEQVLKKFDRFTLWILLIIIYNWSKIWNPVFLWERFFKQLDEILSSWYEIWKMTYFDIKLVSCWVDKLTFFSAGFSDLVEGMMNRVLNKSSPSSDKSVFLYAHLPMIQFLWSISLNLDSIFR